MIRLPVLFSLLVPLVTCASDCVGMNSCAATPELVGCQVNAGHKHIVLDWSTAGIVRHDRVHELWLLDNRPDWKHATGQKVRRVDVDSVPPILALSCNNTGLFVTWGSVGSEAAGVVKFPTDFLLRSGTDPEIDVTNRRPVALNKTGLSQLKTHDFFTVMNADVGLLNLMHDVYYHGVGFLQDAPTNAAVLQRLATRFGGPMDTLYGSQFTMKSKVTSGPKSNIAYSTLALPLHQDLVYFESTPGLQLLHCITFDDRITGGESTLLDVFQVAERLREVSPAAFQSLVEIPVTYQKMDMKREAPAQYEYRKPHISLDPVSGDIVDVTWSPPFEGPLRIPVDRIEEYYRARKLFEDVMDEVSKTHLIEYRIRDGMVAIWNNRRLLHGRNAFSEVPGLERHFEGAYVNIDEFRNRLQVVRRLVHEDNPPLHEMLHIGNRNI